jgi:beta-galactosidase
MSSDTSVQLDARGVRINGRYTTLLCASLFYFRIPEGLWGDRLRKIRAAGYNCIDVYFPWNFHEPEPDAWDFTSGMHDAGSFLDQAARCGLYVMARPGPYICSEWDGGGVPAHLPARGIPIRQNDPVYLSRVKEWYARVMPLIAQRQVGRGGTIALVQIENELDFFDCRDVPGYMTALRDMVRAAGITVPLTACAGQGDLRGAWAGVDGVAPAMNLYLDSRQPDMEAGIEPFRQSISRHSAPLMVTETGRDILILRRLLSAGAKLVGPYNQVGGYDFGFTAGVNNWGSPLSFQTTHYDFMSLVSPFGEVREEAWEHKALGGLVESLGPALAAAEVSWDHGIAVEGGGRLAGRRIPALRLLQEGAPGYLLPVTNVNDAPLSVTFRRDGRRWPAEGTMSVEPRSSAFALFDVDLGAWGMQGRIAFSSAEPFLVRTDGAPALVFQAEGPAEIHFERGGAREALSFDGARSASRSMSLSGEGMCTVSVVPRRAVMRVALDATGGIVPPLRERRRPAPRGTAVGWRSAPVSHDRLFPAPRGLPAGAALEMEKQGAFRGYGMYRTEVPAAEALGIILHDAADVLSVYAAGRFIGTRVPGGCHAFFPFTGMPEGTSRDLIVRAEIWGHSNFGDSQLPCLALDSLRGFSKATLVSRRDPLAVWEMLVGDRPGPDVPYIGPLGARLTGQVPARYKSACWIEADPQCDRFLLSVEGAECPTCVDVDGADAGWVDCLHPLLDLGAFLRPGARARLTLSPMKWYAGDRAGEPSLLQGRALERWGFSPAGEKELSESALRCGDESSSARFPLSFAPGALAWLSAPPGLKLPRACHTLTMHGGNLKATVVFNGRVVGRLFLDSPQRPLMAGGRSDVAYLPSCWLRPGRDELAVLIEAVGEARLESIEIHAVT